MTRNTDIPAGYKPSPLGPIPEDWEVKRLGEIGDVLMCRRILKHQTNISSGIPFFKIGTFGGTPDAYISNDLYLDYSQKYPFPNKGAIIISAAGTIGRAVEYDGKPAYFQDSNLVWIDNDESKVLNRYLYYVYGIIRWVSDTGTISRIYNNVIKQKQIIVPPRLEQRKIAEILSTWDKAIELHTSLIEKLTLRKKGLMQQLLYSKKRFTGYTDTWGVTTLSSIATVVMGQSPNSEYYNKEGEGIPLIQGNADIQDRKTIKRIYTTDVTKKCKKNDVLMTVRAPVGEVAIASTEACLGRGVCAITHVTIDKHYLYYYLQTKEHQWDKLSQGGTFSSINSEEIKRLVIKMPSVVEQQAIAKTITAADQEIEKEKQKLEALKQQKKGLMQQLLTGKKRVVI